MSIPHGLLGRRITKLFASWHYRLPPRLDLPAVFMAIATACFCGRPSAISFLTFLLTVLLELPLCKGMIDHFHFCPSPLPSSGGPVGNPFSGFTGYSRRTPCSSGKNAVFMGDSTFWLCLGQRQPRHDLIVLATALMAALGLRELAAHWLGWLEGCELRLLARLGWRDCRLRLCRLVEVRR